MMPECGCPRDREFAEVLVEGHEYAPIRMCRREYFVIAGILGPFARPDDIVTSGDQSGARAAPHARVERTFK